MIKRIDDKVSLARLTVIAALVFMALRPASAGPNADMLPRAIAGDYCREKLSDVRVLYKRGECEVSTTVSTWRNSVTARNLHLTSLAFS
jgi:hypothetical protein